MRRDLNLCIVMLEESGLWIYALLCWRNWDSLCLHLCPGGLPLCCRAWRLSSLDKRSSRSRSRFREVPTWREGILYLFSRLIKMWCPYSSQIIVQCVIEFLFMIILLFDVYLIIIALYVVILVWGRYNSFCKSLGARGARGARGRLKGCLDQPPFG